MGYTPEPPAEEPVEIAYIDEYGINHGPGIEDNGVVWAPVNCGYHAEDFKYGKLYQWGRKYGQGHGAAYNEPEPEIQQGGGYGDTESQSNIFYARDNDITLHHVSEADYATSGKQSDYAPPIDWTYSPNDKFWNSSTESNPQKTEHDPCPAGWRVPTYTELKGIKNLPSLPTVYTRHYGGGCSDSSYWSSTPSSRYIAWCSTTNYLNDLAYCSDGEAYRLNGLYVRCVKE